MSVGRMYGNVGTILWRVVAVETIDITECESGQVVVRATWSSWRAKVFEHGLITLFSKSNFLQITKPLRFDDFKIGLLSSELLSNAAHFCSQYLLFYDYSLSLKSFAPLLKERKRRSLAMMGKKYTYQCVFERCHPYSKLAYHVIWWEK